MSTHAAAIVVAWLAFVGVYLSAKLRSQTAMLATIPIILTIATLVLYVTAAP